NKKQIQSRRERVLALYSAGLNQDSIAEDMKISQSTVYRDLLFERNHINGQTQNYLQEQLPFEQQICITGINRVIRMTWEIAWKSFGRDINPMNKLRILSKLGYPPSMFEDMDSGHKVALQAMKLAKDCYQIKMNLINGRITVDKAVRFIQSRKVKSIEADTGAEVTNTSISTQTLHKRGQQQQSPS
ncbi:MAG: helix-turn-helix transcriptional regulator, partial [Nitrososphaeraceae archaeon]